MPALCRKRHRRNRSRAKVAQQNHKQYRKRVDFMASNENIHHSTLAKVVDISQVKKYRSGRSSHETRAFVEFTDYKDEPATSSFTISPPRFTPRFGSAIPWRSNTGNRRFWAAMPPCCWIKNPDWRWTGAIQAQPQAREPAVPDGRAYVFWLHYTFWHHRQPTIPAAYCRADVPDHEIRLERSQPRPRQILEVVFRRTRQVEAGHKALFYAKSGIVKIYAQNGL